jgi:hypothetical protein
MLTALADVARRTGYPVVEVPGWEARGRPGGMRAVHTVTCHHTGTAAAVKGDYPSLRVVRDGRSDLPGPLAHYGLGRSGTIYVVAAGKCNHAGASMQVRYTNPYAVGIEAENPGTDGRPWPAMQIDAYHALCCELVAHYGLRPTDVRGHKETCSPAGRKSDPDFNMASFRNAVRSMAPIGPPTTIAAVPAQKEDPGMDWTEKIPLTARDAEVWGERSPGVKYRAGDMVTVGDMIRYPTLARITDAKVNALMAAVAKLTAEG